MKRLLSAIALALILLPATLQAQQRYTIDKAGISHEVVVLDSRYHTDNLDAGTRNSLSYRQLEDTVRLLKIRHDAQMMVPVAQMPTFLPYHNNQRGPLSHFLLDMLMDTCQYMFQEVLQGAKLDFALLNFGGIRSQLPQGTVTKLDIYDVMPFDNSPVLVRMKGSEVRHIFENFVKTTATGTSIKEEAYSRQVELKFENNVLTDVKIGGQPLDPDATYWFVTLDFIALTDGDAILTLSRYDKYHDVFTHPSLVRWVLEDYLRTHYNP
jgi:2',3'-cyclic-nucleotide 2'-phosphodiesterase (5'-nucleotidase family)